MRKLISILLVLVMVLSLTVPALATGDTTTATTEGMLDGGADITVDAETDATTDTTEGVLDGGADITVDAEAGDATDTIGAAPAETQPVPTAADNANDVRAEADQNLIIYVIVVGVLTVLALVAVLIKMHQMKKEN